MELSAGPHFMDASGDEGVSVGHETSVSVGKWLSPVLGLRLTASLRSARSSKSEVMSGTASYDELYHKFYGGARLDALVNPLGFSKRFSWDSRFGFYVLFGGELGRVLRYEPSERLNRFTARGRWAPMPGHSCRPAFSSLWNRVVHGMCTTFLIQTQSAA